MIVKTFEEQVEKFPENIAVETDDKSLTYARLNACANRVAHMLIKNSTGHRSTRKHRTTALLFDHGADMLIGMLGALKADHIYVPLDVNYPENRLMYMLEHSESRVILTDNKNLELAETLAFNLLIKTRVKIVNIDQITANHQIPDKNPPRTPAEDKPAYILYTSGSTGKPRGVLQGHGNILYYVRNWTHRFSLSETDRITLFSALSHDGSIPDIYGALLNGATLFPRNIKADVHHSEFSTWLKEKKITLWHSVPTLFRFFVNSLEGTMDFPGLRFVILGGEPIIEQDIHLFQDFFPHTTLANIYGQTESTVNSFWMVNPGASFDRVLLGTPIDETELLIIDENGGIVEDFGTGEIFIASKYMALEYWKDPETSQKVFLQDPDLGRLYRTGDYARLVSPGNIEFLGRKDQQVKIRGFRVELGEIETAILTHDPVKETVVINRQKDDGETYLCAYLVPGNPGISLDIVSLRNYLTRVLPDYMIPVRFVQMEQMPLTPSNKIDRKRLPDPGFPTDDNNYTPPRDDIEEKLVGIWAWMLGIEQHCIGIDDNYFLLGGHSLTAAQMVSKIHKILGVKVPLVEIFDAPTIRGLGQYINNVKKERFETGNPVEEKEYYPLSAAQTRIFLRHQMEPGSIEYNLPMVLTLAGTLETGKLEAAFRQVTRRHESLRTSFVIVNEEPVQRIYKHKETSIHLEFYLADTGEPISLSSKKVTHLPQSVTGIIKDFIGPLDLSRAPVLKAGLIKIEENKHILMINMSHIISDGASNSILLNDLVSFYKGEKPEPIKLHYKDFTLWQRRWFETNDIKTQEQYWLNRFKDSIPVLNLPADYPGNRDRHSLNDDLRGDMVNFSIEGDLFIRLSQAAKAAEVTTFMFLLAIYNIFLSWCSGQEDIVVGFPVNGRKHSNFQEIIGMFVNLLVIRNYPHRNKSFKEFLEEVKKNALDAYENQDYQYEELVKQLGRQGDSSRSALLDTVFSFQNTSTVNDHRDNPGEQDLLTISPYDYKKNASPFDLHLMATESNDRIDLGFQYPPCLFKRATIRDMAGHFMEVLKQTLENPGIKLKETRITYDLVTARLKNIDDNQDFAF